MIRSSTANGSSCISIPSPPKGEPCANAGVTNIVVPYAFECTGDFCDRRKPVAGGQIGADYSGRRPNCNAALARRKPPYWRGRLRPRIPPAKGAAQKAPPWPSVLANPEQNPQPSAGLKVCHGLSTLQWRRLSISLTQRMSP